MMSLQTKNSIYHRVLKCCIRCDRDSGNSGKASMALLIIPRPKFEEELSSSYLVMWKFLEKRDFWTNFSWFVFDWL